MNQSCFVMVYMGSWYGSAVLIFLYKTSFAIIIMLYVTHVKLVLVAIRRSPSISFRWTPKLPINKISDYVLIYSIFASLLAGR